MMSIDGSVRLLLQNAALQFLFSTVLGWLLLIPIQPWGRRFASFIKRPHALTAAHVDWYLLALMQMAAAFGMAVFPTDHATAISWLLIAGGWLNPVPYAFAV